MFFRFFSKEYKCLEMRCLVIAQELNEIRDKKAPNEYLKLTVIREGELLDIDVKLGEDVPSTGTQENK